MSNSTDNSAGEGPSRGAELPGGLRQVKAVVFDTFGTVVDWRSSLIGQLEAFGRRRGIAAARAAPGADRGGARRRAAAVGRAGGCAPAGGAAGGGRASSGMWGRAGGGGASPRTGRAWSTL